MHTFIVTLANGFRATVLAPTKADAYKQALAALRQGMIDNGASPEKARAFTVLSEKIVLQPTI